MVKINNQKPATKEDITKLDTRITKLDTKVTKLDTKVTKLDTKVTKLDTRISHLDTKLDKQVLRLDIKIDRTKDEIIERMEEMHTKTKSDFYEMIEPFLKELQASREERIIMSARLSNHEDRLEKVERKLNVAVSN